MPFEEFNKNYKIIEVNNNCNLDMYYAIYDINYG